MARAVPEAPIAAMLAREEALFIQRNPMSKRLSEHAARNWLNGVPMQAHVNRLVDGLDRCLTELMG